jgi:hypothetical protein
MELANIVHSTVPHALVLKIHALLVLLEKYFTMELAMINAHIS